MADFLFTVCVVVGVPLLLIGWAVHAATGDPTLVAVAVGLAVVAGLIEFGGVRSGRFHG